MKKILYVLACLLIVFGGGCQTASVPPTSSAPQSSQPPCPYPPLPEQRGRPEYYYREIFFELVDDGDQKYQLHQPAQKEEGKKYPVLIHLHCLGEAETTETYPFTQVTGDYLIKPLIQLVNTHPETYECYAVLPVDHNPTNVRRIVDRLVKYEQADPDRIYLTGTSLGGFGTCNFMFSFPDMLACAVPISGCTLNTGRIERILDLPIRIYHSADDPVVSVSGARALYQALKQAGSEQVTYYELNGYGHMAWNYAHKAELIEWMFLQNRSTRTLRE